MLYLMIPSLIGYCLPVGGGLIPFKILCFARPRMGCPFTLLLSQESFIVLVPDSEVGWSFFFATQRCVSFPFGNPFVCKRVLRKTPLVLDSFPVRPYSVLFLPPS